MSDFELDALRNHEDPGPVVMVNLIEFREQSLDGNGTGREAYRRYSDAAYQLVQARGGMAVWVGQAQHAALLEGDSADWDLIQVIYYPSRDAFVEMVTSPEYLAANVHRKNGVARHVVMATKTLMSNEMPGERLTSSLRPGQETRQRPAVWSMTRPMQYALTNDAVGSPRASSE